MSEPPVVPGREEARDWAMRELSGREYARDRPSVVRQVVDWLLAQLDRLPAPPGVDARLAVAVVVGVLLVGVGLVLWRTGGLHPSGRSGAEPDLLGDPARSAAEHRAAAEAAQAASDWRTALLERFRALVRSLADRSIIDPGPGRTADDLARAAGARLPGLADDLLLAARAFDDVRYGDREAGPDAVHAIADLDRRAERARPEHDAEPAAAGPAVPR